MANSAETLRPAMLNYDLPQKISRAGQWLLFSGIQESSGGVARYYLSDRGRNKPVSTEITGYTASAFAYLHGLTGDERYRDAAIRACRFLSREAWNEDWGAMPFELGEPSKAYFFDSAIIVRGLLAVWRITGEAEFGDAAARTGSFMASAFHPHDGAPTPIISLPCRTPAQGDPLRWSTAPGCYQLKAAMAWRDLAESKLDGHSIPQCLYEKALDCALGSYGEFLPGHPDPVKVVDRLHAFAYFLEGLLPAAGEPQCKSALCDGIARLAAAVSSNAHLFERSDVYAQLLRIRLYADWAGAVPLDREAAAREAGILAGFQASSPDPRIDGGFYFGRKGSEWSSHVSPVSTAFALQALSLWQRRPNGFQADHNILI